MKKREKKKKKKMIFYKLFLRIEMSSLKKLAKNKRSTDLSQKLQNLNLNESLSKKFSHSPFVAIIKHPIYKGYIGIIYKKGKVYIDSLHKEVQMGEEYIFYKDAWLNNGKFIQINAMAKEDDIIEGMLIDGSIKNYLKSELCFNNGFNVYNQENIIEEITFLQESTEIKEINYEEKVQFLPEEQNYVSSYKDVERITAVFPNFSIEENVYHTKIKKICEILLISIGELDIYNLIEKANVLKTYFTNKKLVIQNDINYLLVCLVLYESINLGLTCFIPEKKRCKEVKCKNEATHNRDNQDALLCEEHALEHMVLIKPISTRIQFSSLDRIFDLLYKEKYFKQNDLQKIIFLDTLFNKQDESVINNLKKNKKYKQLLQLNFENVNIFFTEYFNVDLNKCLNKKQKTNLNNFTPIKRKVEVDYSIKNNKKTYLPILTLINIDSNELINYIKVEFPNATSILWSNTQFKTTKFIWENDLNLINIFLQEFKKVQYDILNTKQKALIYQNNCKKISQNRVKIQELKPKSLDIDMDIDISNIIEKNNENIYKQSYANRKIINTMSSKS